MLHGMRPNLCLKTLVNCWEQATRGGLSREGVSQSRDRRLYGAIVLVLAETAFWSLSQSKRWCRCRAEEYDSR